MSDTGTDSGTQPSPGDGENSELRYPANSVVGIIATADDLAAANTALTEGGFLNSEIEVMCGDDAASRLRDNTGRTGLPKLAMRIVTALGIPDDETLTKSEYADALQDGRFVMVVMAPTEERKTIAARTLQQHGGTFINFLGRRMIERMGRARPL